MSPSVVESLAGHLALGSLLDELRARSGSYDLLEHWTQGEFHHDLVLRVPDGGVGLPGPVLVVATNCNGGVKEVLCFAEAPTHGALWHWRCPAVAEFAGALPPILARATTVHFFNPCELLAADARSELRPEFRERQPGGGWQIKTPPRR
jgi:hypothetical protein